MKRYWIMLAVGFALLFIDIVVLLIISRNAPSYIFAIIGLILVTALSLILISALCLIIALIRRMLSWLTFPTAAGTTNNSYYIVVRDTITNEIVDRVAIEETTPGHRLARELPILQGLMKKTLEKKYPPPRYEILETRAETRTAANQTGPVFSMTANRSSLIIVNLGGIILGGLLLLVLLLARTIFSLALFLVGVGILTAYLTIDYALWNRRGIRRITIDPSGITMTRGKAQILERLERSQITSIDVLRKLNRIKVVIYTGGKSEKATPGVTFFAGPRIIITNDAFHDAEFNKFLTELKNLGYPLQTN